LIQAETLALLEWPRLCQHLSTFASTKLGVTVAQTLPIPTSQPETLTLLAQTQEVHTLENRLMESLKFDGIRDIGEALDRAQIQGVLTGQELLDVATTLAGARTLRRTIDDQPEMPTLLALVEELRTYPEIEQEIYRCIDDRGKVTDRANPKLAGIREKMRSTRDQIQDQLYKILSRHSNAIQESVITQRDNRYVIPVKATHKDLIPGIVHDTSTSGATLYVEPNSTVNNNNQLRQLTRQEQVEEEIVRRQLSEQIAAVNEDLEKLLHICTILDLATARSRYSEWLGANPPRLIDRLEQSEKIVLRQLRHPLLVWQQQHEAGREVVPTDLLIDPHIRVVAITGPNTGGKTVTLKTLGLVALMAKVGLFIPAREPAELPWFDQILTDIGDEQSLEQSLSTFSGHIRRIGRILSAIDEAGSNCLVLLDEVGAGTDPTEGTALAIALLKHLAATANLTIATTHFGELKALKYQDDRFENASVEFDDVSLSPTYRLLWGIPGRSNALSIARRLGLKESVITEAQTYVGGDREDLNQVIAGLEAQRREQEAKALEAQKLIKQAEFLYEQVSRKADKLRDREQELKQQQEAAVQTAITDAKSEIAKVIRKLQKGNVTGQDAQQATQQIDQIANQQLPSRQTTPKAKPGYQPKVGDRIRIPRIGQKAEVLSITEDGEELTVRFGIMKMTIGVEEIESLQGEKVQKPEKAVISPPPPPPPAPAVRTSQNTIDLRGSRVMDAEVLLDRAIAATDSALWIIHGHGTGKLRQGIHDYLQQHARIQRFEIAPREDGGAGVTIAYIK
jgi:DNA mismatch repair protein MutS2